MSDYTLTRAPASASITSPGSSLASRSSVGKLSTLKSPTKSCKKLSRYGITWQALRSSPQPTPPRSRAGPVRWPKTSHSSCYTYPYLCHHTYAERTCTARTHRRI